MTDLRRLAASRLAHKSKGSGRSTPKNSRIEDDEEDWDDNLSILSDNSDWSVASVDTLDSFGTDTESTSSRSPSKSRRKDHDIGIEWREKLNEYIDSISLERKNSSTSSREDALARICKIMCMKYAWRIAEGRHADLEDGVLRSLKNGRSDKETILAAKVLSVLVVTDPENAVWYTDSAPTLKDLIFSVEDLAVKAVCITALGSVTFFSSVVDDEELEQTIDFLLDIVTSDGSSIQAADSDVVVAATINVIGFLISKMDDAYELAQSAIPVMVDQLESSEVSIRMAAGNVIALLYERFAEDTANYHTYDESSGEEDYESKEAPEDDARSERSTSDDDADESEEEELASSQNLKRPQPKRTPSSQPSLYYDEDQLIYLLTNLATSSTKRIAKSSRKVQHSVFRDILETVKTAIGSSEEEDEDNMGYEDPTSSGSKPNINRTLKFEGLTLSIESWAAYVRLCHVKHILSIGLPVHYTHNRVIRLALDPQGSSTYEKIYFERSKTVPSGNEDLEGEQEFDIDPSEKSRAHQFNAANRRARDTSIKKARDNRERQRLESELNEMTPGHSLEGEI
ncbi:interferon-related developmental regulator-domain-containing protein [Myxozyma melibiosi]|uniref:Interferon-related developmental regulator-domain-containing protein n=1 Tax=Myxozyma melibiosi TaxID=54550 RepID=A0ABR1F9T9_9ASCO